MDYIQNLISRICDRSDQLQETQTISWQALREAEQLANHAYIPVLYQYIEHEDDKERRRAALYIIAQLSRNTNDPEVIRFLIDRLKIEQDPDMVTGIQQDLERGLPVPSYINVQPLLNNTLSANTNVRRSALLALKGTKNPMVEDWILQVLQRTVNEYDIYYITVLLNKIATRKSLAPLKRLLEHHRHDVRSLAFATIADIEREKEVLFYARCLMRGQLKFEAMQAIYKYADENAIQAVINRITELLSRKRTGETHHLNNDAHKNGFTDLMLGMEFLWKFRAAKAEVKKTFSWIAEKRADYLLPEEREWIQRNGAVS